LFFQLNSEFLNFDLDDKKSVSVANSNPTSIWNEAHTSLFDPSPLKSMLFHGTPLYQKSAEGLMQHYFDLWRENKILNSGEVSSNSISHAVVSMDGFKRLYTIPSVDLSDNPLQASMSISNK
jgi:hypothetical protein